MIFIQQTDETELKNYFFRVNIRISLYLQTDFSLMKKFILIGLLINFTFVFGQNKNEIDKLMLVNDSIKGGSFTVEVDQRLSNLIENTEKKNCPKPNYKPPRKLTPADKCVSQQKIMGYKIQIFYTKDRNAAEKVKNDFARQNPNFAPELIYAAPDYRILVGDYFTRKSASSDLRRIQRTYPSAFTVQWRVWCRKAI